MPSLEQEIQQEKFRNMQHKAIVNLVYTANWLTLRHARFLKQFGLTEQQFNILRILRGQRNKPASISLIRERMLDKMSDVSRLVERMRQQDLVRREICNQDRRSVEVVITKKGLDLLAEIDKHSEEVDSVVGNLSETELVKLSNLLDKIRK